MGRTPRAAIGTLLQETTRMHTRLALAKPAALLAVLAGVDRVREGTGAAGGVPRVGRGAGGGKRQRVVGARRRRMGVHSTAPQLSSWGGRPCRTSACRTSGGRRLV